MHNETCVFVFADWLPEGPALIGRLYASFTRNKEMFSFEYDDRWIERIVEGNFPAVELDPDLPLQRGRQYLPSEKPIFGMFSDSCPDRWGRLLMKRREAIRARKEARKPRALNEIDYYGESLSLSVDRFDSSISYDLAVDVCKYFGIGKPEAQKIVSEMKRIISTSWKRVAKAQGLSRGEIEAMAPAFNMEYK